MTVAAIIPTIPERAGLLAEAVASVEAQTHPVDRIAVETDGDRDGPAITRNRAVASTDTVWLAFLDDDDLWHPHHIATLLERAEGQDVVYPDCELSGPHNGLDINHDYNPLRLAAGNYIPVTALVRRAAFDQAGGFDPDDRYEDWGLWLRLMRAGARFLHVPTVTWVYRWHGAQRTFA